MLLGVAHNFVSKFSHIFLSSEQLFSESLNLSLVEIASKKKIKPSTLECDKGKKERSKLYLRVLATSWHNSGSCALYRELINARRCSLFAFFSESVNGVDLSSSFLDFGKYTRISIVL